MDDESWKMEGEGGEERDGRRVRDRGERRRERPSALSLTEIRGEVEAWLLSHG